MIETFPDCLPRNDVVATPADTVNVVEEITSEPIPCCAIEITLVLSDVLMVPLSFIEETLSEEAEIPTYVPKAIEIVELTVDDDDETLMYGISSMPRNT